MPHGPEIDQQRWLKTKIILFLAKVGAFMINSVLITLTLGVVGFGIFALYIAITKG